MGIRFACHVCGKHLNIKQELAGRRGICPSCSSRFRIPKEDAEQSTPIEEPKRVAVMADATVQSDQSVDGYANANSNQIANRESATVSSDANNVGSSGIQEGSAVPTVGGMSTLDFLTHDSDATWYVRPPTGGQYGPANGDILRSWISEGRVAATALLWRDGWPQWRTASDALPELSNRLPDAKKSDSRGIPSGVDQNKGAGEETGQIAAENVGMSSHAAIASGQAVSGQVVSGQAVSGQAVSGQLPVGQDVAARRGENDGEPFNAAVQNRAAISGEEFGYEDSDFATGNSYTPNVSAAASDPARLVGRGGIGADRRNRSMQRTLSIVLLGIVSILLIAALIFVTTRGSAS
ncbi:MAG: DUF4339 domain-containing protein [Pirellulaceae bacterium]|nr:DUF4339 domain-containing protein [Pirellulaceae bacterium]